MKQLFENNKLLNMDNFESIFGKETVAEVMSLFSAIDTTLKTADERKNVDKEKTRKDKFLNKIKGE